MLESKGQDNGSIHRPLGQGAAISAAQILASSSDSQAGELDVLWTEHMFVDERPGLDASTPCMASTARIKPVKKMKKFRILLTPK